MVGYNIDLTRCALSNGPLAKCEGFFNSHFRHQNSTRETVCSKFLGVKTLTMPPLLQEFIYLRAVFLAVMPKFVSAREGTSPGRTKRRENDMGYSRVIVHSFHTWNVQKPDFNSELLSQIVDAYRLIKAISSSFSQPKGFGNRLSGNIFSVRGIQLSSEVLRALIICRRRSRSSSFNLPNSRAASSTRSLAAEDESSVPMTQVTLTP